MIPPQQTFNNQLYISQPNIYPQYQNPLLYNPYIQNNGCYSAILGNQNLNNSQNIPNQNQMNQPPQNITLYGGNFNDYPNQLTNNYPNQQPNNYPNQVPNDYQNQLPNNYQNQLLNN